MALEFRRGSDAQRQTITPLDGEPIWTTDTNVLYVGDGVTPGGIALGGGGLGDLAVNGTWIRNKTDGDIYISPQDGQTGVYFPSDTQAASNSPVELFNFNSTGTVVVAAGSNNWVFNAQGGITFPDSTVQTTAYTGGGGLNSTFTNLTVLNTLTLGTSEFISDIDGTLVFRNHSVRFEHPDGFGNIVNVGDVLEVTQINQSDFGSGGIAFNTDFVTFNVAGSDVAGTGTVKLGQLTFPDNTVQTTAYIPNSTYENLTVTNQLTIGVDANTGTVTFSDGKLLFSSVNNHYKFTGGAGVGGGDGGEGVIVEIPDTLRVFQISPYQYSGDPSEERIFINSNLTYFGNNSTGTIEVGQIVFPDNSVQTTAASTGDITFAASTLTSVTNAPISLATQGGAVNIDNWGYPSNAMRITNATDNESIIIQGNGDGAQAKLRWHETPGESYRSIYSEVRVESDGVQIINSDWSDSPGYDHHWKFNTDGSLSYPTLSTPHAGSGQTLKFNDPSQQVIITNADATPTYPNSSRMVLQGGEGYDNGEGGDIYLWAGNSGPNGGSGGDIKIDAGYGHSDSEGGTIKIRAGASDGGIGGFVDIHGGQGVDSAGPVRIYSGDGNQQLNIDNTGVNVNNTLSANTIKLPGSIQQDFLYTGVTTTIDMAPMDMTQVGTVKYIVQVRELDGNAFHSQECFMMGDGTNTYLSQSNVLTTGGELGTFSMDSEGSTTYLRFTPNYSPDSITIRVNTTAIIL